MRKLAWWLTFIKDGRLVSIPAQYKKRRYVMEELARSFEWGRLYDEKEVNAILKTFHDDVASLRREFIDQRIMMRESGRYWLVRPNDRGRCKKHAMCGLEMFSHISRASCLKHRQITLKFPGMHLLAILQPLDTFRLDKSFVY